MFTQNCNTGSFKVRLVFFVIEIMARDSFICTILSFFVPMYCCCSSAAAVVVVVVARPSSEWEFLTSNKKRMCSYV